MTVHMKIFVFEKLKDLTFLGKVLITISTLHLYKIQNVPYDSVENFANETNQRQMTRSSPF